MQLNHVYLYLYNATDILEQNGGDISLSLKFSELFDSLASSAKS